MNITSSILHLIPEAQFMCWENDYARVEWGTNTQPLPSLADLEVAWAGVQAADIQSQANAKAQAYLASTDWMVLRQADSGEVMPNNIKDARAAARLEIKQ
jgi:hypothetical protein